MRYSYMDVIKPGRWMVFWFDTRQRCVRFVVFIGMLNCLFLYISVHYRTPRLSSCDYYGREGVIQQTCMDYRANLSGGSLCRDLCDRGVITLVKCVDHKPGRTVLFMNYTGLGSKPQVIVLKVQIYQDYATQVLVNTDSSGQLYKKYPTTSACNKLGIRSLGERIRLLLSKQLGRTFHKLNHTLLSELWGYNYMNYVNSFVNRKAATLSALCSIWLLIQQREFVIFRLNQNAKVMPRLYGTCGPIFAMEYADPIASLKYGFYEGRGVSVHMINWFRRARYAIKILELEPSFNTDYIQRFHMCDLKDPNIGMRLDGEVSLIDVDHGFYESELFDIIGNTSCTHDLQCGLLGCPGLCNKRTRRCSRLRTNNNLQVICEKVFLDKLFGISLGLLRGAPAPVAGDLTSVLHQCAYPDSSLVSPMADMGTLSRLQGHTYRVLHYPGDDVRLRLIDVVKKGIDLET